MEKADVIVIGAGVVGLALAARLSRRFRDLVIVEKQDSFGRETSSRNSEVVHGGMYYPVQSLKARLCVQGRGLLYRFCEETKVPFRKTGKLIVACAESELPALEKILRQGNENGVEGLSMLDSRGIAAREPECRGIAAVYSPETGIIDSHRLMQAFLHLARENGAVAAFNSEVTAIRKFSGGYVTRILSAGEAIEFFSPVVVNSAGLDSDSIAGMAGFDVDALEYRLHYCKGQYFRVPAAKARRVKGLVYPVPSPSAGGLGVHATPDLGGGLRLGPDDFYLSSREKTAR